MLIARKNYTTGTTMKVSIPATVTDLESSLYADSMTYCGYNIKVLINTVSVMDHYSCNDLDHYIDISTYLNEAVNTIKLDSVSQSPQFAVVIIYQG
jgi:hypothetical protein